MTESLFTRQMRNTWIVGAIVVVTALLIIGYILWTGLCYGSEPA